MSDAGRQAASLPASLRKQGLCYPEVLHRVDSVLDFVVVLRSQTKKKDLIDRMCSTH